MESNQPKMPSLADRYPLRTFDVALKDVVGWSEEKVLTTLGQPDNKKIGKYWHQPLDPSGPFTPGHMMVDPGGTVLERVYVFGVIPQHIPVLTPYEEWAYDNVQGQTWLLYLTHTSATPVPPSPLRRRLWQKLTRLFGADFLQPSPLAGQRVPLYKLKPPRPLVVAEVNMYPTGAVF
jgi:hypothetical protein